MTTSDRDESFPEFLLELGSDFHHESVHWWNKIAQPPLKKLIVASAYYEHMASKAYSEKEINKVADT